ncbi:integral peroxisomal membrane peroxin-domain-containing protein [Trametes punicea]|nr:integral peroxisomal membrane peroxin-domain-containing protein [Trametes punicea]
MMSKPSDDALHASPLVEFLNALPSPLTTTLVGLAPSIARARYCVDLTSWKAPWEDCCLTLALWWTLCLIPEFGLRYILPPVTFLLFFIWRSRPAPQPTSEVITEDTIQRALADLTAIQALLPTFPSFSSGAPLPSLLILLRAFCILYAPYLLLTYLVRLRILLAIGGTILFTWRARWAAVIRRGLWRSAYLRWAAYRTWSFLSGEPLPPITYSPQSRSDAELASLTSTSSPDAPPSPGTSIRFLFTIYENQRWWMGLDWTAALLPGERPSWCTASQQPAAPPSAFALPSPTTVYTLAPDGKRRLKRTARWTWEEPEWRVVVRREGAGTSRVERPLPSAKEESAAAASASRILKAAGKMRQPSVDHGERRAENQPDGRKDKEDVLAHAHADSSLAGMGKGKRAGGEEDEEPYTDPDGWVYADNKWEGASSKGGMGKYTRYRRWTRVAVLTETIELVGPGELGIQRDEPLPASSIPSSVSGPVPDPGADSASPSGKSQAQASKDLHTTRSAEAEGGQTTQAGSTKEGKEIDGGTAAGVIVQPGEDEGSRLRQRLKAVVKGATSSHS